MTVLHADRVQETSTITGTGTLNLDGTSNSFETFVEGIGTGGECIYCIRHQTADEWEIVKGVVTDASPDTLTRATVLKSSNADALVSFSAGTKDVFLVVSADRFRTGAQARMSGVQTVSSNVNTSINFAAADTWDPYDLHDIVTLNERIVADVPMRVLAIGTGAWAANSTGYRQIAVALNGSAKAVSRWPAVSSPDQTFQNVCVILELDTNDYVSLTVLQLSGGNLDFGGTAPHVASLTMHPIGDL